MRGAEENVSPQTAREWLKRHKINRPVKESLVRRLTREMKEGRWKVTHQAVAFDKAGNLIDGQHRLRAIVRSGATVPLYVVRGANPDTFDVLDSGLSRSSGDRLALEGVQDAPRVASLARNVLVFGFGERDVTASLVHRFAIENADLLRAYVPLARSYTAAFASAFAYAEMAGLGDAFAASERLMACDFDGADWLRKAVLELAEMRGGTGAANQKARFSVAMTALKKNLA